MSRSYRKTPVHQEGQTIGCKLAKRIANSKIRHIDNIPSGKAYQKFTCRWDIRDWSFMETKESFIKRYQSSGEYPDLNYWSKLYYRK